MFDAFRCRPAVGTGTTIPARIAKLVGQPVEARFRRFQIRDDPGELLLHGLVFAPGNIEAYH